jgi:hypothetical protein
LRDQWYVFLHPRSHYLMGRVGTGREVVEEVEGVEEGVVTWS